MGLTMSHLWKEDEPDSFAPIKYDPQFGFDGQRKKRVNKATIEEMESANIEPRARDSCTHLRIAKRDCVMQYPWMHYKCKGLQHELTECYNRERVHDMMEFERERRLNIRERRIRQAAS